MRQAGSRVRVKKFTPGLDPVPVYFWNFHARFRAKYPLSLRREEFSLFSFFFFFLQKDSPFYLFLLLSFSSFFLLLTRDPVNGWSNIPCSFKREGHVPRSRRREWNAVYVFSGISDDSTWVSARYRKAGQSVNVASLNLPTSLSLFCRISRKRERRVPGSRGAWFLLFYVVPPVPRWWQCYKDISSLLKETWNYSNRREKNSLEWNFYEGFKIFW